VAFTTRGLPTDFLMLECGAFLEKNIYCKFSGIIGFEV
jgi:hypothetical protein